MNLVVDDFSYIIYSTYAKKLFNPRICSPHNKDNVYKINTENFISKIKGEITTFAAI
jgi:hypothetical protein